MPTIAVCRQGRPRVCGLRREKGGGGRGAHKHEDASVQRERLGNEPGLAQNRSKRGGRGGQDGVGPSNSQQKHASLSRGLNMLRKELVECVVVHRLQVRAVSAPHAWWRALCAYA